MINSGYHERVPHRTGNFPLAFYSVDPGFSRYHMMTHWHDEVEFIRVQKGQLRLFLDNSEFLLEEGDFCAIGSGTIHGGEPEDCVYQCIVFNLRALTPSIDICIEAMHDILYGNTILKNGKIATSPELSESIRSLFESASDYHGNVLCLLSRIYTVLHCITATKAQPLPGKNPERGIRRSEQIKPALEYIERNYAQHITLEQLAALSGFSPKYFCRYFRSYVHRSPIDYLNYYRIERSAEFLLAGSENVAEIAVKCGFTDSSAFIKQFKRYKGITPKQYQLHTNDQ